MFLGLLETFLIFESSKLFVIIMNMLVSIILTAVITVALCAVAWWMEKKLKVSVKNTKVETVSEPEVVPTTENDNTVDYGARDLFFETLKKIGCTYEIDDHDRIEFHWQGGYFIAEVSNDAPFAIVWYTGWESIELSDVDALSRARKVINQANISYNMNVLYAINEEDGMCHLHTKKHFLFIRQIPNIEGYLIALLHEFFVVRHYVEVEMDKLKNQEELIYKR